MFVDLQQNPSNLLNAVFDNLFDAVAVVDGETGRFLGANEEALSLLGYEPDELRALRPDDIHPHEIPRLRDFLKEVRVKGRWISGELSCRRKCGDLVPAEIRATRAVEANRELIIIVIRDRRIDQLAELGRSIRKIAHDLRNTLATAQLLSDSLMSHGDRTVRRNAETIARAVDRALHMSRQALGAGKSSAPPPQHERFLLIDVVEEVRNSLGIDPHDGQIKAPDEAAGAILDADFDQIYRILLNLSRNALDAGATTIGLSCERGDDTVEIRIADNGPGLPQDMADQLFEEKTGPSRPGKTGLGLMISRELARNHSGDLILLDTGPWGTAFQLRLPAKAPSSAG